MAVVEQNIFAVAELEVVLGDTLLLDIDNTGIDLLQVFSENDLVACDEEVAEVLLEAQDDEIFSIAINEELFQVDGVDVPQAFLFLSSNNNANEFCELGDGRLTLTLGTGAPTGSPTSAPTESPTPLPTDAPTLGPTNAPTTSPTASPVEPIETRFQLTSSGSQARGVQRVTVTEGETLILFQEFGNTLEELPTLADFQDCNFDNAIDTDLAGSTAVASTRVTVEVGEVRWFASEVSTVEGGSACSDGLKLAVVGINRAPQLEIEWFLPANEQQQGSFELDFEIEQGGTIRFSGRPGDNVAHNLVQFLTKDAFDNCELGDDSVITESRLEGVDGDFEFTVRDPASDVGTVLWYGCTRAGHCDNGQKITVNVVEQVGVTGAPTNEDDEGEGGEAPIAAILGAVAGLAIVAVIVLLVTRRGGNSSGGGGGYAADNNAMQAKMPNEDVEVAKSPHKVETETSSPPPGLVDPVTPRTNTESLTQRAIKSGLDF